MVVVGGVGGGGPQLVAYAPLLEHGGEGGRRGRDGGEEGADKAEADDRPPAAAARDLKPFKWCVPLRMAAVGFRQGVTIDDRAANRLNMPGQASKP